MPSLLPSLPPVQVGFELGEQAAMEGGRGDAPALLLTVVVEEAESVFAQEDDGDEVAGGEEGHAEVDDAPDGVEGDEGSEHDHHAAGEEAIEGEGTAAAGHETDIGLAVVVVADDAGIGEKENGHGDEGAAPGAYLALQGDLREDDAVELGVVIDAADEDDEGGAGADDEGVGEDAEGLDEALLDGVGHGGGGGGIGGAALAGFVGEEATLDAVHDGGSDGAAHGLVQTEGAVEDEAEDAGHGAEIHSDDDDGQEEIADGHHGHEDGADMGDALDAAEDDDEGQHDEDDAHDGGAPAEGALHGAADGVGLNGVVGQTEGQGDEHGEEHGHPAAV